MNRSMHDLQTWPRIVRNWAQFLTPDFGQNEAQAIARHIAAHLANRSPAEIPTLLLPVPESLLDSGTSMIHRIAAGEAVQYVIGTAWFLNHPFAVSPAVLIPRPETEELTLMACTRAPESAHVLDIGTGSGCIAISLKLRRPDTTVCALDVSSDALDLARQNATTLGANISLETYNILKKTPNPFGKSFDVIISNPPYIHPDEASTMTPHVLNQEPALALFAPSDDPLLFYRAILNLSQAWQHEHTLYLFEINPAYAEDLVNTCHASGFSNVDLVTDLSGKSRFLSAQRI